MSNTTMPKDFGFGPDEEVLRDLARKFLRDEFPVTKLRELVASDPTSVYEGGERPAWDESLWKRCVELGWTGLAVPEALGGAGIKLVGIAALVEEVGHVALPSPLVASLNATYALREAGTPEADAWLARIAEGATASLAISDATGSWGPQRTGVHAAGSDAGLTLSGAAHFVQDAFKSDFFVVNARAEKGHRLCVVPAHAPGVRIAQDHIHDLTRDQATLHFDDVAVPAEQVVSSEGAAVLERAWPAILVTVSADLCGTSEWQLQTTTDYAKTRKQFDRPIGFFQAVKHPLSNAMIKIDRARSLLYHAACCVDHAADEAMQAARMAKSAASDAGKFMSDRSVQLHGGIGFTWECDVHLYFKRSLHNQALYGDGVYQRRKLADAIVGPIGAE
jgi:alkylation response protein AidB-like acyl-CoA dehydrogenase